MLLTKYLYLFICTYNGDGTLQNWINRDVKSSVVYLAAIDLTAYMDAWK